MKLESLSVDLWHGHPARDEEDMARMAMPHAKIGGVVFSASVEKQFEFSGKLSDKALGVMRMFGVDMARLRTGGIRHACQIQLRPGQVCYITGPSGSGKSVIMRELYKAAPKDKRLMLDAIELPADKRLVDCFEGELVSSLKSLSMAGLSDVFTLLSIPAQLSDGQKYRFRLAMAMASKNSFIFADEFCSNLDRITAAVIAYSVRRYATKSGKIFILSSSHDDIISDLAPDMLVIRHLNGRTEVRTTDETD
jgi:ABC-type ATPase with predicted acetyltransferase domain